MHAGHAEAGDAGERSCNRWARNPARLRARHRVAIQQHQLRASSASSSRRPPAQPLFDFLQQRIFGTLGMTSIQNIDEAALGPADASRYTRMASAPVRPAPKEGQRLDLRGGRAGHDRFRSRKVGHLADQRTVLKPESCARSRREMLLANGAGTGYGLGVSVRLREDIASSRTAAKSPASPRRTSSIQTMASPSSC